MSIKKLNKHRRHAQVRKWANKRREEIFNMFNNKCNNCPATTELTIHHKEYKIGYEFVEVLCNKCHRKFHKKELKKKLILYFINELKKYNKKDSVEFVINRLQKQFDNILVQIIPETYKIDGL